MKLCHVSKICGKVIGPTSKGNLFRSSDVERKPVYLGVFQSALPNLNGRRSAKGASVPFNVKSGKNTKLFGPTQNCRSFVAFTEKSLASVDLGQTCYLNPSLIGKAWPTAK